MTTRHTQDKLLTIVVPVYNTEAYLPKCLDSVLNCKNRDVVELLVINDGSPDNSDAVISQYAQDYPQIVRYIRKKNGGWGSCINLAMREAEGKYFKILDSDDYYDTAALGMFVDFLSQTDADMVLSSMTEISNSGFYIRTIPPQREYKMFLAKEHFKGLSSTYPIHMTSYKTSILKDNAITLSKRYYADLEFNLFPLPFVQTVAYVPYNVYQYQRIREEASTSTRGYALNRANYMTVATNVIDYYIRCKDNLSSELDALLIKEMVNISKGVYNYFLSPVYRFGDIPCNTTELRNFSRYISEHSPEILRSLYHVRKKGVPYIWIWVKLHFNILKLGRLSKFFRVGF